jgi:hypothetical protein
MQKAISILNTAVNISLYIPYYLHFKDGNRMKEPNCLKRKLEGLLQYL